MLLCMLVRVHELFAMGQCITICLHIPELWNAELFLDMGDSELCSHNFSRLVPLPV